MKAYSLLFLRVSLGILMLIWGLDKLVNVEHGIRVSEGFYMGIFSQPLLLQLFGVAQGAAGLLIVLGLARKITYPLLLIVTGATALVVWRSIIDPWGWFLEGSNALFYPSLIIFAGSLVLWSFQDEDRLALDRRRNG